MRLLFSAASAVLATSISVAALAATVTKADWGKTPDGAKVEVYTLTQGKNEVRLITYGARVLSIRTPDKNGNVADIALGHSSIQGYVDDKSTYFGAIVGRYGNRIAHGKFTLDGKTYTVPANNNGNALHGGPVGFDRKVWAAKIVPNGVEFSLISPPGDMGFPGTLTAHVTYTLSGEANGAALKIAYEASTDAPTVVNLTNHTYFNLSGKPGSTILDHQLTLNADHYTPVDSGLIPTGNMDAVAGTPMDFRTSHAIGERINDSFPQLKLGNGYDHNWILNGPNGIVKPVATVKEVTSGRTLTVTTTEPGVQFYSGNFLDGTQTGLNGEKIPFRGGFCLETQHYPDSPNHPGFPTTTLLPGKPMHSVTVFQFGVTK